jgi:hypothetical protein
MSPEEPKLFGRMEVRLTRGHVLDNLLAALKTRPKPAVDYSSLDAVSFVDKAMGLHRRLQIQTRFMIVFRGIFERKARGFTTMEVPQGFLKARLYSSDSIEQFIKEMYAIWPDPHLIVFLGTLEMDSPYIDAEFERRANSRKVAREFWAMETPRGDPTRNLQRLLQVDHIKGHMPWIQDSNDIKQDALLRAFEFFRENKQESVDCPFVFPFPMLPPEEEQWNFMTANWLSPNNQDRLEIISAFKGDKETIPDKVRDYLREQWRKRKRRTNISQGRNKFPKSGPESWRANWDFSKPAAKERAQKIHSETSGLILNPQEHLEERETQREILKRTMILSTRAYETAAKRSGKRGIAFLNALKAGETEADAATAAGISTRTGQRILKTIRETTSAKIPLKTRR